MNKDIENIEERIYDNILELAIKNYIVGNNDKSLDLSKIDKEYIKENMNSSVKRIIEETKDDIMNNLDFVIRCNLN